jgi:hypothetical protein
MVQSQGRGHFRFPGSSGAVLAASIQTQPLRIGGIGETRCITIAQDGTMIAWNDTTGAWKGDTAAIPGNGPGTYQWQSLLNSANAPSSWLQAPTPYLGWQPSTFHVGTVANNSSLIYMMYNIYQGSSWSGVLLKSTDKGQTWSLTNYPLNGNNGNGQNGAGAEPGVASQTTVIDPNNNNIVWASDGAQLRVSVNGGGTWASVNPAGSAAPASAMCYDTTSGTTGGSTNRLIVGVQGQGIYVSTDAYNGASAHWSLISGSTTSPGIGRIGSDGVYYCTDFSARNVLYRLAVGGSSMATIFSGTTFYGFDVDPNNPARVFIAKDGGGLIMCTTAANTGTPSWSSAPGSLNLDSTDAPGQYTFNSFVNEIQMTFDPWTTASSSTINLSSLSAGGATGVITVPANIPNITVGRQLRCTNTGTPGNYFVFNVTSYVGNSLQGTVIGSAQGGYLGGPKGGSGSFSAWTISAERVYATGDGPVVLDGFSTGTQNIATCKFGIEGSYIADVKWPLGGNPAMTCEDRMVFQVPTSPWAATIGVVTGYSPASGPLQSSYLDHCKTDPGFWLNSSWAGIWFSASGAKVGTFVEYTNQLNGGGPVASATPDYNLVADPSVGMFYTRNGSTIAATFTQMPAGTPTSGWAFGAPFLPAATMCADRVIGATPFIFYALNSDGHIYKFSVPASGIPTVTQGGFVNGSSTTVGAQPKLDSVNGRAGHLFYCPGAADITSNSYATLFSNHPSGGDTRLAFSSNGGATWTFLTSTQEVIMFAVNGAIVPGGNGYPTIYACGWCGGGSYGIYQCINFDPANLGSENWIKVATYGGAFDLMLPSAMGADPNQYNRFITGSAGGGAAIFESPNLSNGWYH